MPHILAEIPNGVDHYVTTLTLAPSPAAGRWRVQAPDPAGVPVDVGVALAVEVGVLSLASLYPDVATTLRLHPAE